ncbi:unnamed protein product [Paramecium octaurelia]|uniref:Uncharacterized protein n=1 Tax=Paramecium octaurelia TaxID=43137 RepID=A0A8S1TPA2_PAROT|nr:unnamed protein product [Paramecium octaurelia]
MQKHFINQEIRQDSVYFKKHNQPLRKEWITIQMRYIGSKGDFNIALKMGSVK